MNEKDKELIRTLGVLLRKFKNMFRIGSSFFHHAAAEDDRHVNDISHYPHKNVDLVKPETVNDATGENAIPSVLKKENLTNQDN